MHRTRPYEDRPMRVADANGWGGRAVERGARDDDMAEPPRLMGAGRLAAAPPAGQEKRPRRMVAKDELCLLPSVVAAEGARRSGPVIRTRLCAR